jgi:ankyrin repeat protein
MAKSLFTVAGDGRKNAVQALLADGVPPDQAGTLDVMSADGTIVTVADVTPLMRAVAEGHPQIAQLLMGAGADPAARSSDQWTPLMMAVIGEDLACVQAIMAAGVALEDRNDRGETALWLALEGEDLALSGCLADAGADLNAADQDGNTPLMVVVDQPISADRDDAPVAIVRWLLAHDVDMSRRDSSRRTALDRAMGAGQDEVVRLLLGLD